MNINEKKDELKKAVTFRIAIKSFSGKILTYKDVVKFWYEGNLLCFHCSKSGELKRFSAEAQIVEELGDQR